MNWSRAVVATTWLKQGPNQPLLSDLLWSRPENKRQAGKLLIIGGRAESFAAPARAYTAAQAAGIGSLRVILPEASRKVVAKLMPEAEFAPSNASGSFARQALANWLEAAEWADGVLLAGDFGTNSETTVLLEKFVREYAGHLTVVGDCLNSLEADVLTSRRQSVVVADFRKIQKLAIPLLIKHTDSLMNIVDKLAELSQLQRTALLTWHAKQLIVAVGGRVSSTPLKKPVGLVELAAYASVWHLQNPSKLFEALTTAVFDYKKARDPEL